MNTILMENGMKSRVVRAENLPLSGRMPHRAPREFGRGRQVADYSHRCELKSGRGLRHSRTLAPRNCVWLPVAHESLAERVMFAVMTGGGLVAVTLGLASSVGLVHNWASIQNVIAQMIR